MTGLLEGVKVVEMGQAIAAPAAAAMLADWGAEVIKVEPLTGEGGRGAKMVQGVEIGAVSWMLELHNRNKRGLAVDLKKESGRDILYQLIKKADVFISNYRVIALGKLKLDYASLSRINPGLIYGVVTGYGTEGPEKDDQAYDHTAGWARSGTQYIVTEPGRPPPHQPGGMYDRTTGTAIVAGILAALLYREKTGKGQELGVSLYQAAVWSVANDIESALVGTPIPRRERTKVANPIWNSYQAKDDRWLNLAMIQSDRYWPDFCRAIERPDLEKDPRFNTMEMRTENCGELVRILDEVFVSENREEWEKRLKANDCIYGRVETPMEVINDPQALANNFFTEIDHPVAGKIKLVNTPVKFRQNPATIRVRLPEVGQHNEEILLELGYGWDDIARLKEQEVIL